MTFPLFLFTILIPLENKISVWLNLGSGFNITNIFTILLLISALFNKAGKNNSSFIKNPLAVPVILLIITTYLSFLTGYMKLGIPFFDNEFRTYKSFITTFILFFIITYNVKDKRQIKLLLNTMAVLVLIIAIFAIRESRESDAWHFSDSIRAVIFGMQPNMLGAFLAQFLPVLAAFFFLSKRINKKILYIGLFAICFMGVMFTYSRGAYLAVIGALVLMGFLGGKRVFSHLLLLIVSALLVQAILFGHGRIIPVSVHERFDMIKQDSDDKSKDLRKEVWALAGMYIRESPFFGYGYGASDRILYLESQRFQLDTHNMYLDIALECGIPTLLIFIWFLFAAIRTSFKVFKSTQDELYKAVSLGALGSVTALAIGNYFGTRLILFAANGYFGILMGMVARIYAERFSKKNPAALRTAVN